MATRKSTRSHAGNGTMTAAQLAESAPTNLVREEPGTFEFPVCPRCNTLLIDHFRGRVNVGCPDVAIAGAMAATANGVEADVTPRRVAARATAEEVPGMPTRTVRRVAAGAGANGRNAVVYVVANTRKRWDAKAIDGDTGMTPREKEMFRYVLSQAKSNDGGAVESKSNVDLGEGSRLLKQFGVDRPFTAKACESALYGLKAKGYITPQPVR